MTLPKTISPLPLAIDLIDTASSGAEVPKATLFEVEKVSDIGEDRGGGWGSTGMY